jgi:hypothetical protein
VIRFSALGDVAMTIPVIYSCAVEHPELEITVLSRSMVAPLFTRMPANVHFQGVNLKEFGGLAGLHRLYQLVRQGKFDAVADFHDVLRTKYLRFRFRLAGVKVAHIDKGRAEKKALTRMNHKCKQPLKTTVSRYVQVLHDLGLSCTVRFASLFGDGRGDLSEVVSMTGTSGEGVSQGVAGGGVALARRAARCEGAGIRCRRGAAVAGGGLGKAISADGGFTGGQSQDG